MEALLLLVSQLAVSAEHDLQMPGEVFFSENLSDTSNSFAFFTGDLQQWRILTRDLRDRRVAEKTDELTGKVRRTVSFTDEMVDLAQDFVALAVRDCLHDLLKDVRWRGSDEVADGIGSDLIGGRGDRLVQD